MKPIYNKVVGLSGLICAIALIGFLSIATSADVSSPDGAFVGHRQQVLSDLYSAIEDAKVDGKYECCIQPACTMCYLGEFIWESGECHCDDLISRGQEPCPQCEHKLGYDGDSVCEFSTNGSGSPNDSDCLITSKSDDAN